MTKTEAAEIIATDVRAFAHRHALPITMDLVESRVSECRGFFYAGTLKQRAALACSTRTVLRLARALEV